MPKPEFFSEPLSLDTIERLAEEEFGSMIKFVVDVKRRAIAAGGALHADAQAVLVENGSSASDCWGGSFHLDRDGDDRVEFASMINIRPADGNHRQELQPPALRRQVRELAAHFFSQFK